MASNPYRPPGADRPPKRGGGDRIPPGALFVECPGCGATWREEGEAWRTAARTGKCQRCRCFFDPDVEAKVAERKADPQLVRAASRVRTTRFLLAGITLPLGLLLGIVPGLLMVGGLALILVGALSLAFAFRWNVELEARHSLERQTDLRHFARRFG